jgi:hypothetical protein
MSSKKTQSKTTTTSSTKNFKSVLIGTPSMDGKLDAWYVNSLTDTIRVAMANNVYVKPVFLAYENVLPMAKNELFKIAYENNFDHIIFINADVSWDPLALMEIIHAKEPVIGLPCSIRSENSESYNIILEDLNKIVQDEKNGLVKVFQHGTEFFKIDRNVLEALWNSSISLEFRGRQLKLIWEYQNQNSIFNSEDIVLCDKIKKLGFDIWTNPKFTCTQTGSKVYTGNFQKYIDGLKQQADTLNSNLLLEKNIINNTSALFDI